MSNQSGIGVSSDLATKFPEFVKSDNLAAVLHIDHQKEHVDLSTQVNGTLADLRKHLAETSNGKLEARYIALRLPGQQSRFAFVQFMPDEAPLSSKMKYASSQATVHKQLGGSGQFDTAIFWTTLEEVSDEGLSAHEDHENAPAPMTEEEASLATAIQSQSSQGSSVAGQSTLAISANVTEPVKTGLKKGIDNDTAQILQVALDGKESIDLVSVVSITDLAKEFAGVTDPRFVVGKFGSKSFFAVTCPRESSIKQRMLLASTRISFSQYVKTLVTIDAQIETFDPEQDLSVSALEHELADEEVPTQAVSKLRFSRPKPPRRK